MDFGEVRFEQRLRMKVLPGTGDIESAEEVLLRFGVLPYIGVEHAEVIEHPRHALFKITFLEGPQAGTVSD